MKLTESTKSSMQPNFAPAFNAQKRAVQPSHLYLVTPTEVQDLRHQLARGCLPLDLDTKLTNLSQGSLAHCFIEQNCRTIIDLLQAVFTGSFKAISPYEQDLLLRVLAYVRKDDDGIPDYCRDGFIDDQQEIRAALAEVAPLFDNFKSWRLRHQVPALWLCTTRETAQSARA
jgi:hypothetical protein